MLNGLIILKVEDYFNLAPAGYRSGRLIQKTPLKLLLPAFPPAVNYLK